MKYTIFGLTEYEVKGDKMEVWGNEFSMETEMNNDTIVVTRHPGMVQYLLSIGLIEEGTPVLSHVSRKNQIKNKNVIGVLPLYLACQASSVTEIPLPKLPVDLRGKELSFEQVREYAEEPQKYMVTKLED